MRLHVGLLVVLMSVTTFPRVFRINIKCMLASRMKLLIHAVIFPLINLIHLISLIGAVMFPLIFLIPLTKVQFLILMILLII